MNPSKTGCRPRKQQGLRAELGDTAKTEGTVSVKCRTMRLNVKWTVQVPKTTTWPGESTHSPGSDSLSLRKRQWPWRWGERAARRRGVGRGCCGHPSSGRTSVGGEGVVRQANALRALACRPPGAREVVWPKLAASVGMGWGAQGCSPSWAVEEAGRVNLRCPVSDLLRSPSRLHTRVAPRLPPSGPLCIRHRGSRRRPRASTSSPVTFELEWVWTARALAGREPARRGPQLTTMETGRPAASPSSVLTWPR